MVAKKNAIVDEKVSQRTIVPYIIRPMAPQVWNIPPLRKWVPAVILVTFTLATTLLAFYLDRVADTRDSVRYAAATEQLLQLIQYRLDVYTNLLQSSQSFRAVSPSINATTFYQYADALQLDSAYPGAQGLGLAKRVSPTDLDSFVAQTQQEISAPFTVIEPRFQEDNYIITYLYPPDKRNQRAMGFNMYSDPLRRAAMDRARDTGTLAASAKVVLIQDAGVSNKPGFLIYAPFYDGQHVPSTIEERRQRLQGFIYSPFRADALFQQIFEGGVNRAYTFTVYDGTETTTDNLIFSASQLSGVQSVSHPRFTSTKTLDVAGRTWTIEFATTPFFESAIEKSFTPFLFGGGLLISILLFLFSQAQLQARAQAEQAAQELQQSQLELRLKNRQITDIFESITDGFFALDNTWIFTYINKEGARMLSASSKNIIGHSLWDIFPEVRETPLAEAMERALKENVPQAQEIFSPRLKAWLSVRCYPATNGLSVYFQDVTSRKHLEQQKDEFMAIASHELKTPVTSLKAFAQVLHRKFLKAGDTSSAEMLGKMNGQINRLTNLIMDLLDVSKIEAGKLELHTETFSLRELTEELLEELQHSADTHQLTLTGNDVTITADRERIGQVISNLVANALKYSPQADQVEISLEQQQNEAIIHVRDFGVGIPADKKDKIFKRFYRVTNAGKTTFPGLGLGLYISAEIVRRHKGRIWVESEEGVGSTFSFALPLGQKKMKA